jgi:putative FmdB family regulatory protein
MPVYTYRCENCGVQFDRYQKFSDQPLTWCPECNKKTLQKVYQPVGIVFKGSGFYSTDHRSPSGQSRVNSEKAAETKSETKTETKPAESSPTPPKSETKSETKSE